MIFLLRGGWQDFYEIELGTPTTQGLYSIYLVMLRDTKDALMRIHHNLMLRNESNYDEGILFGLGRLLWDKSEWEKRGEDFTTGYKYKNPLWWLLEPHNTDTLETTIDIGKSGKLITIPYSELYVLNNGTGNVYQKIGGAERETLTFDVDELWNIGNDTNNKTSVHDNFYHHNK